jgi:hypothetical protein
MSTRPNELEHFRRVAADGPLRAWLEAQQVEAVRVMSEALDMQVIYRAQGQYLFAKRQLDLLDKAKDLR